MVDIINKYNLNNVLKYEFFKANHTIQGLICHNLFLIQLKSKSKNNTINILNKIEYKLVNKNKWLTYFLEKKYEVDYLNKLIMFKYYMFSLIYDIQNIQSLFEIDFIKKEIDKVERCDYRDYDDFNDNFIIEHDYYNKKYNLFSKKHYIIKDVFNNNYNDMIESSYKNIYSECSNFNIDNDNLRLNIYSTDEEDEKDNNYTDDEIILDVVNNIIFSIMEIDYFNNLENF